MTLLYLDRWLKDISVLTADKQELELHQGLRACWYGLVLGLLAMKTHCGHISIHKRPGLWVISRRVHKKISVFLIALPDVHTPKVVRQRVATCASTQSHVKLLKHAYRVFSLGLCVYSPFPPPLPSHLYSQDAKDNKEGTADDHDVADGLQGRHQGLYHQLQARGSADHAGTWHTMGY